MPFYCYICESCGHQQEQFRTVPGAPPWAACEVCRGVARRDYAAEQGGRPADCGEIESKLAVGVLPENARATNREVAQRGLSDCVRFDERTGNAIFQGRQGRLKALKAMGLHDRDEIRG